LGAQASFVGCWLNFFFSLAAPEQSVDILFELFESQLLPHDIEEEKIAVLDTIGGEIKVITKQNCVQK
jgi:hypothetical protein